MACSCLQVFSCLQLLQLLSELFSCNNGNKPASPAIALQHCLYSSLTSHSTVTYIHWLCLTHALEHRP